MTDPNSSGSDSSVQDSQRTYQRLQDLHRTWTNTDRKDRLAASAEEYFADSTYRQSEESDAVRKIDRKLSTAALLSADYHITSNTEAFDRLSAEERDSVWEEYQDTARSLLKNEVGDYQSLGYDEETLYRQGYIEYKVKLEQSELDGLQAWLNSSNPADSPELAGLLQDLNTYRGCNFDLTNMVVARTQAAQILSDKQSVIRRELSQQASDAAQALTEKADEISAVTKSRIMDTVRNKRLDELKETDTSLRQFMEQHPNASAKDWQKAIDRSKNEFSGKAPEGRRSLNKRNLQTKSDTDTKHEIPVFTQETVTALEDTFHTFGEVTESTGFYRKNAATDVLAFFTGDLAPAVNLLNMGGKAVAKGYEIAYRRWLEKSKNAGTQTYRESLSKARQGIHSDNARTRYESRNRIKDIKREHRYEKIQTKRYGSDRPKWDKSGARRHKKFDDTLKGRALSKLNNNALSKALGKLFHLKKLLGKGLMKAGLFLGKGIAMLIGGMISMSIQLLPIILLAFYAAAAFSSLFSFLTPEYAQNCINNLNILDEMYMRAVENEARMKYTKSKDGHFTKESIYTSHDYHTSILLDTTKVGQFINEYGEPVASGNNILPIFMAFKHRTGCDLNKETYVAAAAYGQMMYWRTHSVNETAGDNAEQAHLNFRTDDCKDYKHDKSGTTTSDNIPYAVYEEDSIKKREYCKEATAKQGSKVICGIKEHTHAGDCYSPVCGMEIHLHSDNCFTDDDNDIYTEDGELLQLVADCGEEEHAHAQECLVLTCEKQEHTHSNALSKAYSSEYGCCTGYSYTCYKAVVTCPGHCPGHLEAEYSIQVITDIENIVKLDDLVFTPEARTFGWTVSQFFGTLEGNGKTFCQNISDWWKGLFNTTDLFGLDDFYENYVLDITYGMGKNEASMFKDFGDTKNAIFYNNASVMPELLLSSSLVNYRYRTENPQIFSGFGCRNDSENKVFDSTDYPSPFLVDSFEMEGYSVFLNGWGFYPLTGSRNPDWVWCVDPDFLTAVTGTYADGYQYAVNAFYEESGLYFSNAAPGADVNELEDKNLTDVISALNRIADSFPEVYKKEHFMSTAFNYLADYLSGKDSSRYCPPSCWYEKAGKKVEIETNTILCRKYIVNSENGKNTDTWVRSYNNYYYLYVISEAEKAGNYGAGEKYYYCLVHDADADRQFRFVTMSETDLKLYDRSYKIK